MSEAGTLRIISGVGAKGPACFLLEAQGKRLMLDLGYGRVELLGHLDARAPVTGRLGTAQEVIPWASRFGRRIRPA